MEIKKEHLASSRQMIDQDYFVLQYLQVSHLL